MSRTLINKWKVTVQAHSCEYSLMVNPESHIGKVFAEGKPYEHKLLEAIYGLRSRVNVPGGCALDIGAHIGTHTLWMAAVCRMKVVAFEPIDYERLEANVAMQPVVVRNKIGMERRALGAVEGYALEEGKNKLAPISNGDVTAIKVQQLDQYEYEGIKLMKIDVEDMEPDVIAGGEETIKRCRPIIFCEARDSDAHANIAKVLMPMGYAQSDRWNPNNTPTRVERWDSCV